MIASKQQKHKNSIQSIQDFYFIGHTHHPSVVGFKRARNKPDGWL
jgi:hypothetical protein